MSKNEKILGAMAVVGLGFMLLMMMMGGMIMHTRARMVYASRIAAQTAQSVPAPESGESAAPESVDPKYYSHGYGHFGHDHSLVGRGSRGLSPFGFIGGLFRLAALGFLGLLVLRLFRKRHHCRQETAESGGAKMVDDVEDEIRVGDEIGQTAELDLDDLPHPDEMTVDDLVQAMKRLGIKKLEL